MPFKQRTYAEPAIDKSNDVQTRIQTGLAVCKRASEGNRKPYEIDSQTYRSKDVGTVKGTCAWRTSK